MRTVDSRLAFAVSTVTKASKLALPALLATLLGCAPEENGDDVPAETNNLDTGASPQIEEEFAATTSALVRWGDDVGVIKAANVNCPFDFYDIKLDNENNNNNNSRSGWIGDTYSGRDTSFRVCSVPGSWFKRVRGSGSQNNYAVFKLGDTCPAGSVEFSRYFDGDDGAYYNQASAYPGGSGGSGGNITIYFCMFLASPNVPSFTWPSWGGSYGVIGVAGLSGVQSSETGWVYSDDEDSSNNNAGGPSPSQAFMTVGANTKIFMTRVR